MTTTQITVELTNGSRTFNVQTGLLGAGFYAKSNGVYDGGYRTERQALNGLKRKIQKLDARLPYRQ